MSLEHLIPYMARSIKQRREQLGMSHATLAEQSGFSAEYIEFIETGNANFSVKTLSALAKALNYAPSELIQAAEQLSEEDAHTTGSTVSNDHCE